MENTGRAQSDWLILETISQSQQQVRFEASELNCNFGKISRDADAAPRRPAPEGRVPPKNAARSISTFKILRSEDVWHPRVGAPPGNTNALKHGRYAAARKAHRKRLAVLDAAVRELLRRARRVTFKADEIVRNRAASSPP